MASSIFSAFNQEVSGIVAGSGIAATGTKTDQFGNPSGIVTLNATQPAVSNSLAAFSWTNASTTLDPGSGTYYVSQYISPPNTGGYNYGPGKFSLNFDLVSTGYFGANPIAHFAVAVRHNNSILTSNNGHGAAIGYIAGFPTLAGEYLNSNTVGAVLETWYGPSAPSANTTFGNAEDGNGGIVDGSTYRCRIDSTVTPDGLVYLRYRMWAQYSSAGVNAWQLIVDTGDTLDGNPYCAFTDTGIIFASVFGNNNSTWTLAFSNITATWYPTYDVSSDIHSKFSRFGGRLMGALNWATPVQLNAASTMAIGAAASNKIFVVGTGVSITGFDTIQNGAERTLVFASAGNTLVNSATLALGGSNIATTVNMALTFTSTGEGAWVLTGVNNIGINLQTAVAPTQPWTGAMSRSLVSKLGDWVSVLDFGADPTGVADSTSAIQAALDCVANYAGAYCPGKSSGGAGEVTVVFPHGSYKASYALVNNQRGWAKLVGLGRVSIYSSSATYILDMASCYYCDVSNLNLISSTAGVGIYMNRCTSNPFTDYNTFNNVNVTLTAGVAANSGQGTVGLYLNRSEQNIFENCAFNADIPLWNDNLANSAFPPTNGTQDSVTNSNSVNTFIQCNWTKNGSYNYGMVLNGAIGFHFINNYWNDLGVTTGTVPYQWKLNNVTRCTFSGDFDAAIRIAEVIGYNYFNEFDLLVPSAGLDTGGIFNFDAAGTNYLCGGKIKVYASGTNTGKYVFLMSGAGGSGVIQGNTIETISTSPLTSGALVFGPNILKTELTAGLSTYQEGTWTPNVGGTATYTTQLGTYIKNGRSVYIAGHLKINAIGTGVAYLVYGLPFTSNNDGMQATINLNQWSGLATTPVYTVGFVSPNQSYIVLNAITAGNSSLGILSILTSGSEIYFSGCYESAT